MRRFAIFCWMASTLIWPGSSVAQNSAEVARRIGLIAAYLEKEAVIISTESEIINLSTPVEFKKALETNTASKSPLGKTIVAQFDKSAMLSMKVGPELNVGKSLSVSGLNSASSRVRTYAAYLKSLEADIATLPEKDALGRLHDIYVPSEVMVILRGDDVEEASGGVRPMPFPDGGKLFPYVAVPDGSGFTNDYPSVGAIMHLDDDDVLTSRCTGTLVAPNAVLTAAHCTVLLKNIQGVYFPHAGVFTLAAEPVVHRDFDPSLSKLPEADLALLFLNEPVLGITPAKMNTAETLATGTLGQIVGFGARKYYASQTELLATIGLKIRARIKTGACRGSHLERAICWVVANAGPNYGTTCSGDSGGPLFVTVGGKSVLYGVTSAGSGEKVCEVGSAAYDVDVRAYAQWIAEEIGKRPPTAGMPSVEALEAGVNSESRFLLAKNLERFAPNRLVADYSVDLPDGLEAVRIAVNTSIRGKKVSLAAAPKGSQQGELTKCAPSYLGNIVLCEAKKPVAGNWSIQVVGDEAKEYQLTVTGLRTSAR